MVSSYQKISLLQNKTININNQQANTDLRLISYPGFPQCCLNCNYSLKKSRDLILPIRGNSTQCVCANFRAACIRTLWCTSSMGHLSLQWKAFPHNSSTTISYRGSATRLYHRPDGLFWLMLTKHKAEHINHKSSNPYELKTAANQVPETRVM